MKKECQVHMLPTEDNTNLYVNTTGKLHYYEDNYGKTPNFKPQHLYITSDEEPNGGEWCYSVRGIVGKFGEFENSYTNECRKIIATTDPKLTRMRKGDTIVKDGIEKIQILSGVNRIEQSFIKEYCKNPVDKVLVEYETIQITSKTGYAKGKDFNWVDRVKLNPDNTIIIHPLVEKMYSKEEVENLLYKALTSNGRGAFNMAWEDEDANDWIKENL